MKSLYQYTDALKLFISYLKDNNIDAKRVLSGSIKDNLGYLLEFLDSQGIYCIIDRYTVIVYTDGRTEKAIEYVKMTGKVYIINQRDTSKPNDVIVNYCFAIDKAFEYLHYPF